MNIVIPVGGGTPVSVSRKDVNFYDYEGTLLFAYTIAEAQALTALPTQPTHAGLTGQGWNYTLVQVKALTQKCDVGAMYITDDGKTRLYITLDARRVVPLYWSQTVSEGVTVDWGDGATETFASTGYKNTTHTYATAGDYVITLYPAEGCTLGLGNGTAPTVVIGSNVQGYRDVLRKAEIGVRVTYIGGYAFYYCHSLSSIIIPSGVTNIGNYAYNSCHSLSSIVIPSSVTGIGTYVFQYCSSLSSVVIPSSVTSIGNLAFESCISLSSIVIPSGVTSIAGYTFQQCSSLSSIVIPSSVTSIGDNMFQYCSSLSSIVIPSSVTSIGYSAFGSCAFIKEYHFQSATPPTLISSSAFTSIPSDCIIYVPTASVDAYKAATNWSTHAAKMVGE